ncbi:conserved oligomeric Golgi complex subunit 4 [Cryptotermes secundus]|nr:conserved oligomeric Golgi complex subunit 4 [Cryptotermes secundus]
MAGSSGIVEGALVNLDEIQRVYNSLVAREDEINNGLETLLSRQCHLEAKLRGITKVLPNLQIVHSDARQLAEMITFTSTLAENVSAKVRQLDIARGRVSECQQRVHDLLDLQLCSNGVQTALRNEDFEKAAAHVHRFLSMDQHLLKQTADDVAEDCTSVTNSFSLLHEAAAQLGAIVTQKFDEAVRSEDLASVERFFKIFPLLGMKDEGLIKFSLYLCSKLQEMALKNLRAALETNPSDKRADVIYADTLTLLFEGIARVIEIHQPLIETYYGPGRLLMVASYLQRECDRQSSRILAEFSKYRNLEKIVQQVNEYVRSSNSYSKPTDKLDPKKLDLLLGELTIMHSRAELYVRFVRRRAMNDLEVGISDIPSRSASISELEAMLNGSELCHRMQELLGNYLLLERYFMEESVKKAVAMDAMEEGSHTSSMVDDVFFIVRKCIRRASTSSSLDGVCAVINNACALLETDFCEVLKQQLRQGYPSGYLDLTQAYNVLHTSIQQGRLQTSDSEQARLMFLAYLNNADVSTEYTDTLRRSLADEVPSVLTAMSENEKVKLESCLSGLGSVAASLKAVIDYGMQQLRVSAIKPRVNPWVDAFLSVNHQLSEEDFASYEANEPFIQNLIMNLEGLLGLFRGSLTTSNYDTLVSILATEVTTQMEKVVIKSTFNRLGGLVFDKEVRALVSYLTSTTSWSIRDKFARLTQMATILNLERVTEISDYWGSNSGSLTWRLTPTEVRQIMAFRTDFRSDDIKRLKL